jgi:hypothetical protein
MTTEPFILFLKKVKRMRGLQRELRKTRALTLREKEELSRLEREVDQLVKKEEERQHSNQSEIF